MSDLETDIRNAIEISKYTSVARNKYNQMINYSRIYQNTTENVREYMMYCGKGGGSSALVPTASGDQLIEAILNDYSNITCFDINRLTKYYVKLKLVAITCFSKREYVKFLYEDMLNIDMFNYIKEYLDDDTRIFWEELFKNVNHKRICIALFRHLAATNNSYSGTCFSKYCADNYTSHMRESNYRKVQEKLNDTNIEFIDSDILDLISSLEKKYDFINLTNIYEYVNKCPFSGNDKRFAKAVRSLISNNLNEDGKILISYLYRCCLIDLCRYRDKPLVYARILNLINNFPSLKKMHDTMFKNEKVCDKLFYFRKFQLLRWLDDIDISALEVDELGLGADYFDKDLVLVYKNSSISK